MRRRLLVFALLSFLVLAGYAIASAPKYAAVVIIKFDGTPVTKIGYSSASAPNNVQLELYVGGKPAGTANYKRVE